MQVAAYRYRSKLPSIYIYRRQWSLYRRPGPALRVLSRFRSDVRPTSHRRRGTPSIEEPVWVRGDWIIHQIRLLPWSISCQLLLVIKRPTLQTKGRSFPGNLAVPGNRPHRPGYLRHRRFPQPSLFFLFLKGLRFITPKAFSELLKLSREYQMLTKVTDFRWTRSQRVFKWANSVTSLRLQKRSPTLIGKRIASK